MKKMLLFLSFAACSLISNAQTPSWLWVRLSGGGDYQYPNGISVDATDTLYIAGRYAGTMQYGTGSSISGGNDNPFVAKLDSTGNGVWIQNINYGYYDYPWGFWRDNKNNVYSSGIVSSGYEMFVEKYDRNGNLKWNPTIYGAGIAAQGMAVDGAGAVYITGSFNGTVTLGSTTLSTSGGQGIFVAKLDSNGNFLWAKSAGGTGGSYDGGRGMTIDEFANVYITGGYIGTPTFGTITAPPSVGYSNLFIAEYDSSGNAVNVITANSAGLDNGDCCNLKGITIDSCNNLYVTGYYEGTAQFGNIALSSQAGKDIYVAKCDNSGNWQWVNDIGSSGDDYANAITLDKNSDVYVGGEIANSPVMFGTTSVSGGYFFVAKYDNSDGSLQWVQTASNYSDGGGIGGLAVDNQKYVYVIGDFGNNSPSTFGSFSENASSDADIFVAKLDTVAPRTIIPVLDSVYCPGSTVTIPFSILGTFNSGNVFTVQLSDSTGSFVNNTVIGSDTSTNGGTITITIPAGTSTGSNYLIRVVSSNPAASSYVNGCGAYYQTNVYPNDFYITIGNTLTASVVPAVDTTCSGGAVKLTASGGTSYLWSNNDTSSTITVFPTTDTIYRVTVSKGGCTGYDSVIVTVKPVAPLNVQPQEPTLCDGQNIILSVPSSGTNYTWSPSATLSPSTGDNVTATPTSTTTYTVTGVDSVGCNVSGSDVVSIITGPSKPTITQNGNILTSSATQGNQWQLNDVVINGATNQTYKVQIAGWYTVVAQNPANGCSTTSDSIYVYPSGINQLLINNQLSIYPNPTSGEIAVNISSSVMDIKDWNLEIADVLGRIIYTRLSLNYNNNIDLSNLPNGVYFITVINKTGRTVVPVVKQN